MTPKIDWFGERPTNPPAEQIENAVSAALDHPRDLTPLAKLVVVMRLEQDVLRRHVKGIGYSSDDTPLVRFHYQIMEPWVFWCEALDPPSVQPQ